MSAGLGVVGIWFGYRLVNWPRFADFLISVEAELNKVSVANAKRIGESIHCGDLRFSFFVHDIVYLRFSMATCFTAIELSDRSLSNETMFCIFLPSQEIQRLKLECTLRGR